MEESKKVYKIIFVKRSFPFNKWVTIVNAYCESDLLDIIQRHPGDFLPKGYRLDDIKLLSDRSFSIKPSKVVKNFVRFVKDLFMEKGQWSLARISFAVIFGFVVRSLLTAGADIPVGVLQLVGVLLGYIFLGKTSLNTLIDSNNDGVPDAQESDMPVKKGTP